MQRLLTILIATMIGFTVPLHAGPPKPATEEEIRTMIEESGDAKDYDNATQVYLLDEADVFVQDSGLATTESCQIIKILKDAGIRSWSVLREEYDPATNRVTIKRIRIHREDGSIEDVPTDSMITRPAPQHMIYWGNRHHLIDIPRLAVGDCLEIRISKIGFNIAYLGAGAGGAGSSSAAAAEETLQPPMPGHWYEVARFQVGHPIVEKRYTVYMPKDKPLQYEVYNGVLKSSLWFDGDHHVYSFSAEDIPPVPREAHALSEDDHILKVVMATVPDWEMKSRWFWDANKDQFEADDAIRAKVAELTAGLEDEEAKIAAMNHWVADNIRYYGTSRGPCEGFTLHTGIETFRDKGGVCKDKAGMLITMCRAAGIDAYPALTMAGPRVEEIPADQFNHTVTAVRGKDGTFRIYDPTWIPDSREMWSSWEALQGLVYGTPEGEGLTLSPHFPPEYNKLTARSEGRIEADGTLSTRIRMEMSGSPCTAIRRNISRTPIPERTALFERSLNIAPNARIEQIKHSQPRDYTRDSFVDMTVSAAAFAAGSNDRHVFRLPLMSHPLVRMTMRDFGYSFNAEERKTGVRMRATRLIQYEETLTLPDGWKIEHVPDKQSLDSGSAKLEFEATPGDGTLTYRFEFIIKHNRIPAEDYPDFKKAFDTMTDLAKEWIVCTAAG
jgi:hypothetical protein